MGAQRRRLNPDRGNQGRLPNGGDTEVSPEGGVGVRMEQQWGENITHRGKIMNCSRKAGNFLALAGY